MRTPVLLAPFFFLGVGCGGSATDAGGGTGTLYVDGEIEASPQLPNASELADFDTEFEVRIRLGDQNVTTGDVFIDAADEHIPLVYSPDSGSWHGRQSGYHRAYELDIVSGEHAVEGVTLEGPDVHWFETPLPGAVVDASLPLEIAWGGDHAEAARLDAWDGDAVAIDDTGEYVVPAFTLQTNDGEARDEEIELERWSRIAPAGAVGGSELTVTVRNRIEILVAPCPTCPN